MTKVCLSKSDIKILSDLLKNVFLHIIELRGNNTLAQYVQFPKIPPYLSESMIIHLIKDGIILPEISRKLSHIGFGGSVADVLVKLLDNNNEIKVEVKATGKSAFQKFGVNDINADYLIWVHFNEFFLNKNQKTIEIFIIKDPSRYISKPDKITLSRLLSIVGSNIKIVEIQFNKIFFSGLNEESIKHNKNIRELSPIY